MSEQPGQDLRNAVSALAAAGVLVQKQLAEAAQQDRDSFVALLAAAPEPLRELLLPLAPMALQANEFAIDCALRITAARSTEFVLSAAPICFLSRQIPVAIAQADFPPRPTMRRAGSRR